MDWISEEEVKQALDQIAAHEIEPEPEEPEPEVLPERDGAARMLGYVLSALIVAAVFLLGVVVRDLWH